MKRRWAEFRARPAGRRFLGAYEARRRDRAANRWWRKALVLAAAGVLFVIGAFFAVAPGPAGIFFAAAAILVAGESPGAARALDRIDKRLDPLVRRLSKRWRALSSRARKWIVGSLTALSVASAVLGIVLFRRA